ncbi:MAG: hypothetical protein P1U32_06700 [Legionellaceae bacterium]|nr:hypothetical protein [Legionellaceae bacterium]
MNRSSTALVIKMASAARDIKRTLIFKLLLLFLLWFVCFRGAEKPVVDAPAWLLGHHSTQKTEVILHDSRH